MAQAIADAAVEFCERSLVIRHRVETVNTVSGTALQEIDLPSSQQVARLLSAWVDGRPLIPALAPANDNQYVLSKPVWYYTSRNDSQLQVMLYPTPDGVYKLSFEVALRPTRNATSFENDLLDLWSDGICAGALARVLKMPATSFTNIGAAGDNKTTFEREISRARAESTYTRVQGSQRVQARPLA